MGTNSWMTRIVMGSLVAMVSVSGVAQADVAPPPGRKYAQYGFRVDNMASYSDWVLVAYPCNASNGAPVKAGVAITDDAIVSVGRRGGSCAIYPMKRSEWLAWRAANPAPAKQENDPALDTLVNSGKLIGCQGGPEPRFEVASSAPDTITDTVHVQTLTDTNCRLVTTKQDDRPLTISCSMNAVAGSSQRIAGWTAWWALAGAGIMRRRVRRRPR